MYMEKFKIILIDKRRLINFFESFLNKNCKTNSREIIFAFYIEFKPRRNFEFKPIID